MAPSTCGTQRSVYGSCTRPQSAWLATIALPSSSARSRAATAPWPGWRRRSWMRASNGVVEPMKASSESAAVTIAASSRRRASRRASPPQAAIRCVPLISARPSLAASSIGASPARRSASPPSSSLAARASRAPSPQSTTATWASGARSPEAPTEPRLGTTGRTSRSSRPSSSSTSSGRTPEWPFERLLASSSSMPRTTSAGQRLAHADRVRAHEVELQLRGVGRVDAHRREVAEAGRHAVHDGALGDHRVHRLAAAREPRARLVARAARGAPPRATRSSSARVRGATATHGTAAW